MTRYAITMVFALAGCSEPAPVQSTTAPVCQPQTTKTALADSTDSTDSTTSEGVTFYGDLLPVLSSDERGSAYKCTTCHAHYAKPDGMNNVREVEHVVESMRSGRMPRVGDAVPQDKIELFTMWRLQGFKAGTPRPKITPEGLDAQPAGEATGCTP